MNRCHGRPARARPVSVCKPMPKYTNKVVPRFDFAPALSLSVPERFAACVERAREIADANGYQRISDFPCVPGGATPAEVRAFAAAFPPGSAPGEYLDFLGVCKYLKLDDGLEVGGLPHDGVYVTEVPWVSDEHRPGVRFLVFANYWRYADGDQLMFDLSDPAGPVVAYLHEHGPLFEPFAPSFSLALWRLTHEVDTSAWEDDE